MLTIAVTLERQGRTEREDTVQIAVSSTVYLAVMQAKSQGLEIPEVREVVLDYGDGSPMTISTANEQIVKITRNARITVREKLPPATDKVWV